MAITVKTAVRVLAYSCYSMLLYAVETPAAMDFCKQSPFRP